MLNDLYTIYRGLESIGESLEIKHNDIQEPGVNNITFRVILDEDGQVSSVKLMTREQIQHCWSLGNKQTQFPAMKVKKPLIAEGHNAYLTWKEKTTRPTEVDCRDLIECLSYMYLTSMTQFDVWPGYRKSIFEKKKKLERYDECADVYELFNRYCKNETGVEILEQVARQVIISALQEADLSSLKAICALLFGEKLKAKGEIEDGKRITVLLDCYPRKDIDIYATTRDHVPALSRALFAGEKAEVGQVNNGICALTGENSQLVDKKFPEEKLAVIGPTILFAKNEGTSGKTVERYGQARGKAFPVSTDLSKKLAAGISFITSNKYKHKTWSKLPSSSLLLAYCKENYDLPITPLITGESEVEDFDDYLDVTESVLMSFRGKDLSHDAAVDFIEILKVDKANRKINYSTTTRISQLIQAAEQWQQACKNVPVFKLYALLQKNTKRMCEPWGISPQQVIALSKKKYIRDGRESTPISGISFGDAMKLFLGKSRHAWINLCLQHIADQYQPLLRYCSLSRVQGILPSRIIMVKTSPRFNAQALSAVTLIAVFLYKMGRTKELYMNDFAFQLGQLCSAMDEVHIGYCMGERNGSIPNTLLGNQIYGMALHDPVKAMALMATRRRPYDSWVKRIKEQKASSDEKAIKNAIYAQIWMGLKAKKLYQYLQELDAVTSDNYKAELMLGYLSGRPFE